MVGHLLVAIGVLALVLLAGTGVAAVVVVRRARRRYRRWRLRAGRVLRTSSAAAAASVSSPGWWTAQHRRHRMWQAVTAAEHALRLARRAGAPVGDLPGLMTRLSAAATGMDAVLRAGAGHGPLRVEDRLDCDRIVATAREVREAALESLRSGAHAETDSVVSALRNEVAAVAAGVRAARG